jgi:aspartyl-tRNA(Asn)/glutamyl-tRNA(Gln) amidotransferase subunit B
MLRYDMPADRFVAAAGHEITADAVAELQRLIDENAISTTIARGVWEKMLLAPRLPTRIVDEDGLRQVSDAGAIEAIIDAVIAGNPSEVERYRAGQQQLFGFLVGQAMKASKGKGDPKLVNARLRSRLDEGA